MSDRDFERGQRIGDKIGSSQGWREVRIWIGGLVIGFLLALLLTSCGHLPPHWCRVDPLEVATTGTPEIRHCDRDACMDRCGYPPTPQCEDACDMDCVAKGGEWIVDESWMMETARAMMDWRECCEEGR